MLVELRNLVSLMRITLPMAMANNCQANEMNMCDLKLPGQCNEHMWPDLDHEMVCGDCKVNIGVQLCWVCFLLLLVKDMDSEFSTQLLQMFLLVLFHGVVGEPNSVSTV